MAQWELKDITRQADSYRVEFQRETMVVTLCLDMSASECSVIRVEIENSGSPVTAGLLREIQLGELEVSARAALFWEDIDQLSERTLGENGAAQLSELAKAYGEPIELPPGLRKEWPRGDVPLVLEWVSRIYRRAVLYGDAPSKEVSKQFGVSLATAKRMVAAARESGVLQVKSQFDSRSMKGSGNNGKAKTSDR